MAQAKEKVWPRECYLRKGNTCHALHIQHFLHVTDISSYHCFLNIALLKHICFI